jgi:hypothetical protein
MPVYPETEDAQALKAVPPTGIAAPLHPATHRGAALVFPMPYEICRATCGIRREIESFDSIEAKDGEMRR